MLRLSNIHKQFGDMKVLSGLDMSVGDGEIYGFLGRNGAGKSTTLQIIMGITMPNQGDINLFNLDVSGDDPVQRRQIGYVAQEQHFYEWMTAKRIGKFQSGFYPSWDQFEYERLLKLLDVPPARKILGFSGGMRAKLALCLALAHRPKLLLLDEPTAGMDAITRREFIDIIRDQSIPGRTTLFSSHLIDEVEMASDKVGILDDGRLIYEGSLHELKQTVKRFVTQSETELPPTFQPPSSVIIEDTRRQGARSITVRFDDMNEVPLEQHLALHSDWRLAPITLEEIFVSMVNRSVQF